MFDLVAPLWGRAAEISSFAYRKGRAVVCLPEDRGSPFSAPPGPAAALRRSETSCIFPAMSTDTLIVLCTCPEREPALRIAEQLVDRRLAACVNVVPGITSVYRWEGHRESAHEVLLVIKTRAERFAELQQAVVELHPYELPELIAVPVTRGIPAYLNWVAQCTTTTA